MVFRFFYINKKMELKEIFERILTNYRDVNCYRVKDLYSLTKETKSLIKEFITLYNKKNKTKLNTNDFCIKSFVERFKNEY